MKKGGIFMTPEEIEKLRMEYLEPERYKRIRRMHRFFVFSMILAILILSVLLYILL